MAASPAGAAKGPEVPAPALAPAAIGRVQQLPRSAALQSYYGLPLIFEANEGQTDPKVKFVSRGRGYTLFLTPGEMVLGLTKPQEARATVVRMKLLGANRQSSVAGVEELPGKANYFIGNDPARWRTNIPTYARVKYEAIYPGVDLVYYGNQGHLEYDFVVAPGVDPKAITLAFEGPDKLKVDAQGDLVLQTASGELRLKKPLVYQEVDGQRKPVAGNYIFKGKARVGFQVAGGLDEPHELLQLCLRFASGASASPPPRRGASAARAGGNADQQPALF